MQPLAVVLQAEGPIEQACEGGRGKWPGECATFLVSGPGLTRGARQARYTCVHVRSVCLLATEGQAWP